mmetsp:Transcript_13860/g.37193  ORF Transcript_13860/g.37193 Transcript_13860/m.37193 type:complete len:403 (+) Transcript_13860:101-1309(+)
MACNSQACGGAGVGSCTGMALAPADPSSELRPLDHIVAGHTVQGKDAMLGANGLLYKPVQKGDKGQREVDFYEQVGSVCPTLRPFLAAYFGTHSIGEKRYLVLEDFAVRYREPCVMDLKIGVVTYEPTATREKVLSELRKCPAQASVGFRPCGMRVFGTRTCKYRMRGKDWGRAITPITATQLLAEFVCDDDKDRSTKRMRRVLPRLLERLGELEAVLSELKGVRFFASSIILVYEGLDDERGPDASAPRGGEGAHGQDASNQPPPASVDLRLVDFAHWVRVPSKSDDNYLSGLRNVISGLRVALDDCEHYASLLAATLPPPGSSEASRPVELNTELAPTDDGASSSVTSLDEIDDSHSSSPPRRGARGIHGESRMHSRMVDDNHNDAPRHNPHAYREELNQ